MDRRVHPRIKANFPVEIKVIDTLANIPTSIKGKTVNISEGGVALSLERVLPSSSSFVIRIDFSPRYPPVQAEARVIWSEPQDKGGKFCAGIQFLNLQEGERAILVNLITDIAPKQKSLDRRRGERRRKIVTIDFSERRKYDRRIKASLLRKCVMIPRADILKAQGVFLREVHSVGEPKIVVRGRELIMLSSCNYLGLTTHPKVKKTAIETLEKYGMSTSSSRIAGGTMWLHNLLEQKLAEFESGEDCIVYVMGYLANIGCIPALVNKNDFVIVDAKSHASIIDACILSRGKIATYKHNDMDDLERKIKRSGLKSNKLIVTDGVFSMDGDIANLDQIYSLAQRYNAAIMVDDAHGVGVLGENGTGITEHFNLKGKIDLVMGTLSKALPGMGGFIVAKKKIIDYLRYASRTFVFNLSLPPFIVAGLLAALEVIKEEPELRKNLWRNIEYLKENLQRLGYDTGKSESAIIPVFIRDDIKTCQLTKSLEDLGVFVDAMVYPAVKRRESRLRLTPMTTHSIPDLEKVVWAFREAGKKLNLI